MMIDVHDDMTCDGMAWGSTTGLVSATASDRQDLNFDLMTRRTYENMAFSSEKNVICHCLILESSIHLPHLEKNSQQNLAIWIYAKS